MVKTLNSISFPGARDGAEEKIKTWRCEKHEEILKMP
jgi:hypothetical protein